MKKYNYYKYINYVSQLHDLCLLILGPYFFSFTIKNLYNQQILLQANFDSQTLPNVDPGKVITRNFEHGRNEALVLMVYDALTLQRLTLNGENEISIAPSTRKKQPETIVVPYNGELFYSPQFILFTSLLIWRN